MSAISSSVASCCWLTAAILTLLQLAPGLEAMSGGGREKGSNVVISISGQKQPRVQYVPIPFPSPCNPHPLLHHGGHHLGGHYGGHHGGYLHGLHHDPLLHKHVNQVTHSHHLQHAHALAAAAAAAAASEQHAVVLDQQGLKQNPAVWGQVV